MVKDLTVGKPLPLIMSFCVPLLIGNIVQQFYNIADTAIVGRLIGKNALAAVGETGSVSFLIVGFVLGICSGLSIPIANAFGAADYSRMRNYVFNSVYICAVIAAVVSVSTALLSGPILQLMKTPGDIFEQSRVYITIIFAGIPATMFYNILAGILRALGDSRTPLYFLIIAALLNVALDVLFIAVFHTGVGGAAVATVLSQLISGILCLMYTLKRFPLLKSTVSERAFSMKSTLHLLGMSLPMALQLSITAIGSIILQSAVNTLGSDAVAAVSTANKSQAFLTTPMETLGVTMATYCSQNLGAGKTDRVFKGVRQSTAVGLIYSVAATVFMWTVGYNISRLFIDAKEVALLEDTVEYLKLNSVFYVFLVLIFIFRFSLQGLGYAVPAMLAGVFEMIARAGVGIGFVTTIGFTAACLASPCAWVAADLLLIPVWFIVKPKLMKIPQKER